MAEIDKLEILVESSAAGAERELSKLQKILKQLSSTLSGVKISDSMGLDSDKNDKFTESLGKLHKALGVTEDSAEKLQKAFAAMDKGFKFSGNSTQLQKEIEKAEKQLDRLWAKEDKMKFFGTSTNSRGWRSLQYDIAQALNKLDILREKEKELASIDPLKNLTITHHLFPDEVFQSFDELHARLQEFSEQAQYTEEDAFKIGDSFDNATKQAGKLSVAVQKLKSSGTVNDGGSDSIKLENVRKSLRERLFGKSEVPTEEFKKLSSEIEKAERHLENLYTRQERMEFQGVKKGSSAFRGLSYDIAKSEKELESLNKAMDSLKSSGGAYQKAKLPTIDFGKASAGINRLLKSMQKLSSAVMKIFGRIGNAVGNVIKRFSGLSGSAERSRMSLARMLGTSLLFSGFFRGIGLVTDGVKTGFENLVQYSDAANASISSMVSALYTLKNSFAIAFAPVVNSVAPYITAFINMLNAAMNKLGQFFAALTGKKFAIQAVGVTQNYADSLTSVSKNAGSASDSLKDLNKAISVLGFDELNKLSEVADNNGKTALPSTDLLPSDMFQTVPIEKSISDFAKRIRQAVASEDWDKLGKTLASKMNSGIQKIYDAINWKKVGPKITKFTTAFTNTFNSLDDNIDWDLTGRSLGAGINTVVNTLNQLIEGIHWKSLGKKFAEGITGIVREVSWKNFGNLLGSNFMISWNILYGLVKNLNYPEIGTSLGKAVNGIFEKVDFKTIGTVFAEGFNGIFDTLRNFNLTVEWDEISTKLSNGLNTMIHTVKWSDAGKTLSDLVESFLRTIWKVAANTDWESFGRGIGEFLSSIDWGTNLRLAVDAIATALGGLIEGLEESGTAGKIAVWLSKVFIAVKVAEPVLGLINNIVKAVTGDTAYQKLYYAFKEVIGKSAADGALGASKSIEKLGESAEIASSGGVASLLSSIATLGGIFAVASGAAWVGTEAVKAVNKESVDTAEAVQALSDALMSMKSSGDLSYDSWDKLYAVIIDGQAAGKHAAEIYDDVSKKLENMGAKTDVVKEAAEKAGVSLKDFETVTNDTLDNISKSVPEKSKNIGLGIGDGTKQGIEDSKRKVKEASEGLAGQIITWFKNVLGIHSPSTVMYGIGQYTIGGLKNGLVDSLPQITSVISGIPGSIQKSLGNLWNIGKNAIQSFVNGFSSIRIPMPHINWNWNKVNFGSSSFNIPSFNLKWYASGGFPNTGELFMANENGPEMIGKMGSRNVVANNKQITEGIENAVVRGMTQVMMMNSASQNNKATVIDTHLYLNGSEIARSIKETLDEEDWRYSPVPRIAF